MSHGDTEDTEMTKMTNDQAPMTKYEFVLVIGIWSLVLFLRVLRASVVNFLP
jgi:hypothetical protein